MMAMDVKKAYLAEVKTALPAVGSNELLFAGVSDSVDAYLADNPSAAVTELYQAIGTPAEVAQAALDEAAPGDIQKKLKLKKWLRICAITIVLIAAVVGSILAWNSHLQTQAIEDYTNGYTHKEVELLPADAEPLPSPLAEY